MWTTARRSRFGPEGENSPIFEDPYILTSSADGDGRGASPTTWTVLMKRAMLEALVAGAREGKRDGNGFKKEVFKSAVDEVNKLYYSVSPGGSEMIPLAVGRIKYKIKVVSCNSYQFLFSLVAYNSCRVVCFILTKMQLKRKYKTFMMLRNGREFGWDEVMKVPNAPDDI